MVSNDENEDENAKKIGKESEVLVVKHLFTSQQESTNQRMIESHYISSARERKNRVSSDQIRSDLYAF